MHREPSLPRRSLIKEWARAAALLALCAGGWRGVLAAQAQHSDSASATARELLQEALRLADTGDTSDAMERVARATDADPDLADAHFLYGLLLARTSSVGLSSRGRRSDASHEFDEALRLDRGNPRYLLEVARLRLKAPILRIQAEHLFRRALDAARARHDPGLEAEVESEIGAIYLRRWEALAHRRVPVEFTGGFDWERALRDQHYTKDMLDDQSVAVPGLGETDLATAEQHLRAGVKDDPASDAANAGLMGLLIATDRTEELLDAGRSFVAAADTDAHAWLYLGLALWRAHRAAAADSAFTRALAGLPGVERQSLLDLSTVLTASQAVAYRQLDDTGRVAYERMYWWAADPLRLTAENEFRLEHFSRVVTADLLFSAPDLRLRGDQTDRGQLLIRYGPPPVIASFAPDVQDKTDVLELGAVTTVWFYPDRNIRFVFQGAPTYNYARLAGDFSSYTENARAVAPSLYDNVPVAHTLDSVPVQVAQFLPAGDSAGSDVVLFAGIPVARLVQGVDLKGGDLETAVFVSDNAMRDAVSQRHHEVVSFHADVQFENRTYTARLAAGHYLYRLEARLAEADRAARGAAMLDVLGFRADTLTMSDVIVADRIAPREDAGTLRGRQDFLIQPNAAMRFRPADPVHLYAEVYNLTPRSAKDSIAEFRVSLRLRLDSLQRAGLAARLFGGMLDAVGVTAKGDDQVTLSYVTKEPLAGRDRVPIYLALDLHGAPTGNYHLDLAVQDLATGEVVVRSRPIIISPTR